MQKPWPLVPASSGGLKITGQHSIEGYNCTMSLCQESKPNPTPVVMLCLSGLLRNQNSRQSLHANTLSRGKEAKVKNGGRRVGEGGKQTQRGMFQSCPQPHKKHCQLLTHVWFLGEAERIAMPQDSLSGTESTRTLSVSSFPSPVSHWSRFAPWGLNSPTLPGLLPAADWGRPEPP